MLLTNFLHLFLESAPWLLLGLVLAGLLKVFVPMAWMQKQLGGHGMKTVVKAALLGAPLPLCSCGVIPAAVGLRRAGASKAATTSFLVSTPETGVDSITVSYVLLGPFMAIVRPIAAITSAIVAGLLVGRDDDDGIPASTSAKAKTATDSSASAKPVSSCCAPKSTASSDASAEATSTCKATATANTMQNASVKMTAIKSESVKSRSILSPITAAQSIVGSRSQVKQSSCCGSKTVDKPAESAPAACCSTKAKDDVKNETPAATVTSSCCSSKAEPKVEAISTSCCSTATTVNPATSESSDEASCCASTQDMATELKHNSVFSRVLSGLHYAATDLVKDTTLWLLVGLFFAAIVQTYVPADFLVKWGDGILAMLVMVLVSIPMYICATASTPIAAGLLLAGVSPGAVLVFMMAGPATNIATLGVVTKELGKRALYGYLGGVMGVALVFGVLVNYLVDTFGFEVMPQIGEEHALLPQGVVAVSGIVLAVLMAKVLWDMIPKGNKEKGCCS
ncbi:SO_0444 family Cu/Zn efflux transporter [Shewanella sp. SG41-4]|uniref:SO_0444 family Cu/Zn efflux transporter n=1 Tax=Shewanella sp. SG41-4 TaxID=2760976 RepID=UPI001602DB39|nr:SO_0444 family Cu/Zn efflux transporter [Shewanella sp. SG41-4]MBB1440626.1 SO_0444 family Cu/Zn efflux transporter [Shewanella sp. SG41-4]